MTENVQKTERMDRRLVKTKRSVQGALLELLTEKALDDITVTELARKADINRKTFYMHYTDIQSVLDEIENELAQRLVSCFRDYPMRVEEYDVRLGFEHLNGILMENIHICRRLVQARSANLLTVQAKSVLKRTLDSLLCDTVPPDERGRVEFLLEYITAGVMNMYVDWISDDRGMPLSQLTDLAVTLVTGGIQRASGKYQR